MDRIIPWGEFVIKLGAAAAGIGIAMLVLWRSFRKDKGGN